MCKALMAGIGGGPLLLLELEAGLDVGADEDGLEPVPKNLLFILFKSMIYAHGYSLVT